MMIDFRSVLLALLIGLLAGAGGGWYLTATFKDAAYSAAMP